MLLLCDNDMDNIERVITKSNASVVIIDSIQTMVVEEVGSAPGTVTQVREVTARLMQVAKQYGIAIFIVGHVTKEGNVAGPRTLEHMVDSVLYFEGDRNHGFRILRGVKNRFGSTNEIGVFTMTEKGLEEVDNPSQALLNGRPQNVSGSVVVSSLEGIAPYSYYYKQKLRALQGYEIDNCLTNICRCCTEMCLFCPKCGFFCPQTPEMLFSFTTKGVEKRPQAFLDPK